MMTQDAKVVLETDLKDIPVFKRGKVRDVYDMGDALLLVASDRISAFDCVCPNGIPFKGQVLTSISDFWFTKLADVVPNHRITTNIDEYPEVLRPFASLLAGRSMYVRKSEVFPIECVVRGYLAGSGWKEYKNKGTVCGEKLPQGMKEAEKISQPIFTPATKAETGHDENIPFSKAVDIIGKDNAEILRDASMKLYQTARDYAAERGIIIADTKFEFGIDQSGQVTLIDEVLTPDSSRFWPADGYEPGKTQPNFDKQFVRDYLESLDWDKTPPAPELPAEIVEKSSRRYLEAYKLLTGKNLEGTD